MTSRLDDLLREVTSGDARVPGVVAMATDRNETIYAGAAGVRSLDSGLPMTTDTVCAMFSTTKAITGTVCLSLVEEGRLDLDAPAKAYAPVLGALEVLAGFDDGGNPLLRKPKRDVTTRMLLTHTAGFGYDFFNERYQRLARGHGQPAIVAATYRALATPLLFDPGERWEYGSSVDWAGQVVEGVTGRRLGEVMHERVLDPLGMTSTTFTRDDDLRARSATVHRRRSDGSLTATGFEFPPDPQVHMGGHGLYSTAEDYLRFIRMWLDDGRGPHGAVLQPETIAMAARNHLPAGMRITALPGVNPALSHDLEFFPGLPKSWGLTFMINDEPAPTGRAAGSLAWAGLANLYFWIDRTHGVGGFWATQLFPFADPTALAGYLAFETAVYRSLGIGSSA